MSVTEQARPVDFYFDFISPYSYLAATRIEALEQAHELAFHWLPLNLPRLIKLSGNTPPATIKNKALYSLRDLKRWAVYLGVPFKMIRPGSFDSRPALRVAGALEGKQRVLFCQAVFELIWSGAVNTEEPDWLEQVMAHRELNPEWLTLSSDEFEANTQQALKAGAFGVPSFVARSDTGKAELFFGLDHMDWLSRI